MSSQSSSSENPSDSDEEVPVVWLCSLPLAEVLTLDISDAVDFTIHLEGLAFGDKERALAAVSEICEVMKADEDDWLYQIVILVGGVDILYRAMKHECERIRAKAVLAIALISRPPLKYIRKVCDPGCIETLVELINTDDSWKVKQNAMFALAKISNGEDYCEKVLEAGCITAILSHLREDSPKYMQIVSETLYHLAKNMSAASYDPYMYTMASFIISHLSTVTDARTKLYIFRTFKEIVDNCANEIGLSEDICTSLIQLIDTTDGRMSSPILFVVANIICATSNFTELFIACGLITKIMELLKHSDYIIACSACFCLEMMSLQASDIVDKIVLSGVIPQFICLIGANYYSSLDEDVARILCRICANCSSALIPQLLEMDLAKYIFKELKNDASEALIQSIEGLIGIIRHCKEISNPELLKSYVNVEELEERCRKLVSEGVPEAKDLLKDVLWVMSGGKKVKAPRKKHKSTQ